MLENIIKVLFNNNFINNKLNILLIVYMLINYNLFSYVVFFIIVFFLLMILDSFIEIVGRLGIAFLRFIIGYRLGFVFRFFLGFRFFIVFRRFVIIFGGNVRFLIVEKVSREESLEDKNIIEDVLSEFIMGIVVCGNLFKVFFSRRKINLGS